MRQWGWVCLRCRWAYRGDQHGHPMDVAKHLMRGVPCSPEEWDRGTREKWQLTCPCGSQKFRPLGAHEELETDTARAVR